MTVRLDHAHASLVVEEGRDVAMSWIDPIGELELGKERHQERLREAEMSRLAKLAQGARERGHVAASLIGRFVAALEPRLARAPEETAGARAAASPARRADRRARAIAWPHPRRRIAGRPADQDARGRR